MPEGLGQTVVIIGVMVAVLLAAYYVTKFLAKKGKRLSQSKHIKVIDQIYLASDKQIALIKVGGKNILVGVTNQNISLISEINELEGFASEKTAREETRPQSRKDFISKARDFVSKAWSAPQDLRNARRSQYVQGNAGASKPGQDDFASIMESINKNKEKFDGHPKDGSTDEI